MRFIRTFVAGRMQQAGVGLRATSKFPKVAAEEDRPPPPPGDSTVMDRRVATTAVQTVRDMWLRSFRVPGAVAPLVGLRGGVGDFDYETNDDHAVLDPGRDAVRRGRGGDRDLRVVL